MDLGAITQNLASSLTGNVAKAILCIRKVDNIANAKRGENNEGADDLTPSEKKAIEDVVKLNDDLMKKAQKTLEGGAVASFDDISSAAQSHDYYALQLQYNPSSLRLDTTAGRQMQYQGGAGAVQVVQYLAPASTTLSCELLFDDTNNMDAFMLSDSLLTGATASNVSNSITSVVKGKYSVQRQMEGLLSLLSVPEARHVIFYWGTMNFRGEMTEVSTKYTMFNKKGYPIRGTVNIQIRQGDGNDGVTGIDKEFGYDDKYWRKSFENTFTLEGSGASAFQQITNNNLLNLKL